jgi:hypothetical protein
MTMEARKPDGNFTFVAIDEAGRLLPTGFRAAGNGADVDLDTSPAAVASNLPAGTLLRLAPTGAVPVRLAYVAPGASAPAGGATGLFLPAAHVQYWAPPSDCDVYAWAASSTSLNVTLG